MLIRLWITVRGIAISSDQRSPSCSTYQRFFLIHKRHGLESLSCVRRHKPPPVRRRPYTKSLHIRTSWFKNLQAEIWHLNTQKYKNLFSLTKKNRSLYKKNHSNFDPSKFRMLIVWETSDKKLSCIYMFSLIYICLDFYEKYVFHKPLCTIFLPMVQYTTTASEK